MNPQYYMMQHRRQQTPWPPRPYYGQGVTVTQESKNALANFAGYWAKSRNLGQPGKIFWFHLVS
jgi:hypothetical protein